MKICFVCFTGIVIQLQYILMQIDEIQYDFIFL